MIYYDDIHVIMSVMVRLTRLEYLYSQARVQRTQGLVTSRS
jgi:hypothetical protein